MRRGKNSMNTAGSLAAHYLRSARSSLARDLEQLAVLSTLVNTISELIHALQKERGASSIYLGSNGAEFADRIAARVADSQSLEDRMRDHLERLGEQLAPMSCSARLYTRVAYALRALDSLPLMRTQVSGLTLSPQDAVKAFTDVISPLLAVGYEAANIAADPEISSALVALVNFAQGKEYAGQERATGGAALSRAEPDADDRGRMLHLQALQDRAFKVFSEFASPCHTAAFVELAGSPETAELGRMRSSAFERETAAGRATVTADAWYEMTTRRIDAMRAIEIGVSDDLAQLCAAKLGEANTAVKRVDEIDLDVLQLSAPVAMVVGSVSPSGNVPGIADAITLYGICDELPTPLRSILDVVEAQSRRIDEISAQLESARTALIERKTIERAKGILMHGRRLSEKDAYAFLRQTAMGRNKRIFEVAEAIIGAADTLKA
jgi:nitrate/nitrite sensing protein/ANTAR domain-containing protein